MCAILSHLSKLTSGRSKDRRKEAAQVKEKDACSFGGVLRGVLDHPNTSVQEESAPEQHTQHGVEGKAPHRAEAFVKMKCLVCKTCDME